MARALEVLSTMAWESSETTILQVARALSSLHVDNPRVLKAEVAATPSSSKASVQLHI